MASPGNTDYELNYLVPCRNDKLLLTSENSQTRMQVSSQLKF